MNTIYINRVLFLLMIVMVSLPGCNESDQTADRVAILKLGTHPLIDEIENSIVNSIEEAFGESVALSVFNANFDDDLLQQSVSQIMSGGYSLAIPITTSASNMLINRSNGEIPIVFSFVSSPDSIWGEGQLKPDFVTGTSDQIDYRSNIRLIREVLPDAKKLGYLVNQSEQQAREGLNQVREIVVEYGFELVVGSLGEAGDVDSAARAIVQQVDAFLVGGDNTVVSGVGALLSVATRNKKPVFAVERSSVEKGAISAYGIDYGQLGVETADLAIRILRGEDPKDISIIYFEESSLFVNNRSADELEITNFPEPFTRL